MTVTLNGATKLLQANDLKTLARCEGPCITIQIPEFHPGAGNGSRRALLRQLAQKALEDLRKFNPSREAGEVESAIQSAMDRLTDGGGPGMTAFFAPGHESLFLTPGVHEMVSVGTHLSLAPLAAAAAAPAEVYALGISRKIVRIWKVNGAGAAQLPLPASVPVSLDAAGAFDKPDHDLENRSASGSGTGLMKGVRFGTMSDHDAEGEYMHKFMTLIYKGVHELVKSAPLFLVGVREDLNVMRRAAGQNGILPTEWHTNPEHCSDDEIKQKTQQAAVESSYQASADRLKNLQEQDTRYLDNPSEVFQAAHEGRVHRLFIAEQAPPVESAPPEAGLFPGENLLNAAAVETLKNGGDVFALRGTTLPTGGTVAAVLRY